MGLKNHQNVVDIGRDSRTLGGVDAFLHLKDFAQEVKQGVFIDCIIKIYRHGLRLRSEHICIDNLLPAEIGTVGSPRVASDSCRFGCR